MLALEIILPIIGTIVSVFSLIVSTWTLIFTCIIPYQKASILNEIKILIYRYYDIYKLLNPLLFHSSKDECEKEITKELINSLIIYFHPSYLDTNALLNNPSKDFLISEIEKRNNTLESIIQTRDYWTKINNKLCFIAKTINSFKYLYEDNGIYFYGQKPNNQITKSIIRLVNLSKEPLFENFSPIFYRPANSEKVDIEKTIKNDEKEREEFIEKLDSKEFSINLLSKNNDNYYHSLFLKDKEILKHDSYAIHEIKNNYPNANLEDINKYIKEIELINQDIDFINKIFDSNIKRISCSQEILKCKDILSNWRNKYEK